MDNLLRLRFIWYRQTPCHLQRVKVHAIWRELQLQFLMTYEILPISMKQESKSGNSSYMSRVIFFSAHRHFFFKGSTIIYYSQSAIVRETLLVLKQVFEGSLLLLAHRSVYHQKRYRWHWQQRHSPRTYCHHDLILSIEV